MKNIRNIVYVMLSILSMSVYGQHANMDVFRQFSSEDVFYNLEETFYYWMFHKGYAREEAPVLQTKTVNNALFQAWLAKEKVYADSIDSAYTARLKVESKRLADRGYITNLDLTYDIDRRRIESYLEKWNNDINKIVSYGGTNNDRKAWVNRYNCIKQAIDVVHDGHEPSGSKHAYYIDVISEIQDWHTRLKLFLMSLVCGRDLRKDYEKLHSEDVNVFQRRRVVLDCLASRTMRLEDYGRSRTAKKE